VLTRASVSFISPMACRSEMSMGSLIYAFNTSLDGYIEDASGSFDWTEPDEELHRFWNQFERSIGVHLYGRRLYETMRYWETAHEQPDLADYMLEYARVWQASEKIVYSTTLDAPSTAHTRVERIFDPGMVSRLKEEQSRDISIGGAELASHAIRLGLVDEYRQVVLPVIVGGGKAWLPKDVRVELRLVDERRFGNGARYVAYAAR
jgi:dihydrofolate reductase